MPEVLGQWNISPERYTDYQGAQLAKSSDAQVLFSPKLKREQSQNLYQIQLGTKSPPLSSVRHQVVIPHFLTVVSNLSLSGFAWLELPDAKEIHRGKGEMRSQRQTSLCLSVRLQICMNKLVKLPFLPQWFGLAVHPRAK